FDLAGGIRDLAPDVATGILATLFGRARRRALDALLHEVLDKAGLQQRLDVPQPLDAPDRRRWHDHVSLDVRYAGRHEGGVDVAPRNRHRAARLAAAHELARLPRQRHRLQFAADARAAALGQPFDAGLGRAGARPAAGLEREHERDGIWQALLEQS